MPERDPTEWQTVTKSNPCEVCGKSDWCGYNTSARLSCCMRVESSRAARNGGWIHALDDDAIPTAKALWTKKQLSERERIERWTPVARQLRMNTGDNIKRLAKQLGVGEWALRLLHVGYGVCGGRLCWAFPERNHNGEVVGISRRLVTPHEGLAKMSVGGRGLTYVSGVVFPRDEGPVLIVEGGSDTAAGITLGRNVIGRPSCTGGMKHLFPMLKRLSAERRIIVVAERDKRPHEDGTKCQGCQLCWPGKVGAVRLQKELNRRLKQRVIWLMPPDRFKDLRGWFNAQNVDVENTDETFELGKRLFT